MVSPDEVSPGEPAAGGGAHPSRGGDAPSTGAPGRSASDGGRLTGDSPRGDSPRGDSPRGGSPGHGSQGDAPHHGGPPSGGLRTGGLRIGDRERDEVTRLLHDAFAQGRITREELDERLDATLSARTAEDLRRVTADLPGAWPGDAWTGDASHDAANGGRWAGHARAGGPWRPGFPPVGVPGFPGSPAGTRPGPYGGPWAGAAALGHLPGPPWARRHWHPHGPAWGHHPAARMAGHRAAMRPMRGGLPLVAIAAVVILTVALASGVAWPLFVVLRLLFVAWLVSAVVGLVRHRHRVRRYGAGHR
ncbi:DUF1707 domain-containing protein [Microbispora sp. NPDC046933]|uniref:DUF1707 SHOCT-like domain-containing protein n=1 Tax=Microbispora sp. NPDC046933 TaxID=3155618 RepID=UPI0033E5C907